MRLFSFRKLFCDLFVLLFFYRFLEVVREKRGRQGEDAWSVEYETWNCVVHKEQRIIINSNASKSNCKFVFTWFRRGVSNRWNGIWNGTVEWKMEWNGECHSCS